MNALDGLKNKMATNGYMTNIEMAIYNTTERFPITALHAAEELAQKDAALEAWKTAYLQLEWVPQTGECLMNCGGDSVVGHNDDCQFIAWMPAALNGAAK